MSHEPVLQYYDPLCSGVRSAQGLPYWPPMNPFQSGKKGLSEACTSFTTPTMV